MCPVSQQTQQHSAGQVVKWWHKLWRAMEEVTAVTAGPTPGRCPRWGRRTPGVPGSTPGRLSCGYKRQSMYVIFYNDGLHTRVTSHRDDTFTLALLISYIYHVLYVTLASHPWRVDSKRIKSEPTHECEGFIVCFYLYWCKWYLCLIILIWSLKYKTSYFFLCILYLHSEWIPSIMLHRDIETVHPYL